MKSQALDLSVVIPVYNESESLRPLYDRIAAAAKPGLEYEVLFVDDGNYDNAPFHALEEIKSLPRVRVIHLSRNFGQHIAIAAGLKNAEGEYILVMDSDLQYDPEECLGFLDIARKDHRALVLSTIVKRRQPGLKAFCIKILYRLMSLLGTPVTRTDLGSVFLVDKHLATGLARMFDRHRFTITMALWLTQDVAFCKVSHRDRRYGKSGYTVRKLVFHAVTGLTSFSSRPLYVALFFSGLFMLASLSGVSYLIAERLLYGRTYLPGWASTITVILACTAAILFCLGILGIYVGRIFDATQGRPLYYFREDRREPIRLFEDR